MAEIYNSGDKVKVKLKGIVQRDSTHNILVMQEGEIHTLDINKDNAEIELIEKAGDD